MPTAHFILGPSHGTTIEFGAEGFQAPENYSEIRRTYSAIDSWSDGDHLYLAHASIRNLPKDEQDEILRAYLQSTREPMERQ